MSYTETLEFLFNSLPAYHRVGAAAYKADLHNTEGMMEELGHPERAFRSVHVAGTNGKGSVSHMLASILHRCGLKVGLYTSPHLVDFRERIRIDGEMIGKDYVVDFVERNKSFFQSHSLSFFEMTVGLAFDYFRSQRVDVAVIEVGMGGRLDSTNVITPLLSVITNIGLEHTQFLGDTLEKIAGEKAGIIKRGVPVVIGESQEETEPVFRARAEELHCDICFADKRYHVTDMTDCKTAVDGIVVDVTRDGQPYIDGLHCPMGGAYQCKNIATVFAAMERLEETLLSGNLQTAETVARRPGPQNKTAVADYRPVIVAGIENVVADTGLHGRWEKVGERPLTVCETAHNAAGVATLTEKLGMIRYKRLHIVYGCVSDKDYEKIIGMLPDASYYWTRPSVQRGLDENVLAGVAAEKGKPGLVFPDVGSAVKAARSAAEVDDLVLVTGSIFLVADYFKVHRK